RLDPPEAYLSEEPIGHSSAVRLPASLGRTRPVQTTPTVFAQTSGILGLSGLGLLLFTPVLFLLAELFDPDLLLLIAFPMVTLLIVICGTLGLALGIQARRAGAWALVGMTCGVLSLLLGFGGGLVGCLYLF